jgi:hypothetical protein
MMAARLRKTHQEDVRTKIQVSQLLNVLQNHALGKLKDLTPTRLKAIEILLKKTLPDLTHAQGTNTEKAMTLAQLLEQAARKDSE